MYHACIYTSSFCCLTNSIFFTWHLVATLNLHSFHNLSTDCVLVVDVSYQTTIMKIKSMLQYHVYCSDVCIACKIVGCTSTQYQCNNGKCISPALRCDHNNDCGDLSDEFGCGKFISVMLLLNSCHILPFILSSPMLLLSAAMYFWILL